MPSLTRTGLILSVAGVLAAGCSHAAAVPSPSLVAPTAAAITTMGPAPSESPSPSPTQTSDRPSPEPVTTTPPVPVEPPAAALAAVARRSPPVSSVTYALNSAGTANDGTVTIDELPAGYRVAVTVAASTAVIIVKRDGDSVACNAGRCLLVATGGAGVPTLFDPQVQHVLTDELAVFADNRDELTVTAESPRGPGEDCFGVKPSGSGPTTVVPGTYCFDTAAHLSYVKYASGGELRLTKVNADPTPSVLTPPSKPVPLPSTTATREPTD